MARLVAPFLLAVATLLAGPTAVAPTAAPAGVTCAGGLCDVCPAVARALTATGAQIYCVA